MKNHARSQKSEVRGQKSESVLYHLSSVVCFLSSVLFAAMTLYPQLTFAEDRQTDLTEAMKQSIVYLETSFYGYEQSQPWRHKNLSENWACACAVGEYELLTTAWNVANLAFVKALRYGQNEFISAKIKVIDYECNLCLIELDPNALSEPLKPLIFSEDYQKGAEVDFYWLSSDNHLYNGRGYLDRATVQKTNTSYEKRLHYIVANTSHHTGAGQVYCVGSPSNAGSRSKPAVGGPIGIACWANENKEAGLIPAETINRFLAAVSDNKSGFIEDEASLSLSKLEAGSPSLEFPGRASIPASTTLNVRLTKYEGFGSVGCTTSELLDPAMRSFLKMPTTLKNGAYVTDVYNLGTASGVLKKADVILAIDAKPLNSYGQFMHPKYEWLDFNYLITSKPVGQTVLFELWRDGKKIHLGAEVKSFKASEMLVPYHEYDQQPEYIITGGFILQKLTREYLARWGDDWTGKVTPHLYHYYRDFAFKPTSVRNNIVILSYVLPADINLGYSDLRQIVVKKFNGMTIRNIADILTAQKLNPESSYDVIEFEMDNPVVVIPREQLPAADMFISKRYGIQKLLNIN